MAKEDKGRIRILYLEMEGANDTLVSGIRDITNVLGRTHPQQRQPQALPNNADSAKENIQPSLNFDGEVVEAEEVHEAPKTKAKRSSYPVPQVLDIDLKDGEVSLEQFCQRKNPTSNTQKYLVIATWFKEYRSIKFISTNHIYTAYRALGWSPAKDLRGAFNAGKSAGHFNGPVKGEWEINHIGLEIARKMGGA